jgi:glutamyl-tRNA reductase
LAFSYIGNGMGDQLIVYHLKQAGDKSLALPQGFWHLATCLRSIVVSNDRECPHALQPYDQMAGERAYEFLLRIICGLDSPLLGETEVLGQFKEFYKAHQDEFPSSLRQTFDSLNRDAKKVRSQFLQNLGCTSYGSLLRKQMKDPSAPLTLVGAGALAQDILPWFAKLNNPVRLLTRNPQKHQDLANQLNVELLSFEQISGREFGGVLVLAAPVSSRWVSDHFNLHTFDHIYDLRGESQQDLLPGAHVTSLQTLFANIEKNRRQAQRTKELAIAAIKERAHQTSLIERPRPFGWDDLWAYS